MITSVLCSFPGINRRHYFSYLTLGVIIRCTSPKFVDLVLVPPAARRSGTQSERVTSGNQAIVTKVQWSCDTKLSSHDT